MAFIAALRLQIIKPLAESMSQLCVSETLTRSVGAIEFRPEDLIGVR